MTTRTELTAMDRAALADMERILRKAHDRLDERDARLAAERTLWMARLRREGVVA